VKVYVESVKLPSFSTVGVGEGMTEDGKTRIGFGGDWRAMWQLMEMADVEGWPLECEVEPWQILWTTEVA
jgi:hypothetical protein